PGPARGGLEKAVQERRPKRDDRGERGEADEQGDGELRLGPEQEPDEGGDRRGEQDGRGARSHTRSLARSPISPVGRSAMRRITTPKANTSLYALANGRATAPTVCSAATRNPPTMAPNMF